MAALAGLAGFALVLIFFFGMALGFVYGTPMDIIRRRRARKATEAYWASRDLNW
jgi:hypothetical protein